MPFHPDDILLNNTVAAGKNFRWIGRSKFYPFCLIYIVKEEDVNRPRKQVQLQEAICCLNCQLWYLGVERQMVLLNFPTASSTIRMIISFGIIIPHHSSLQFAITPPVVPSIPSTELPVISKPPARHCHLPLSLHIAPVPSWRSLGTRGFSNPKPHPLAAAPELGPPNWNSPPWHAPLLAHCGIYWTRQKVKHNKGFFFFTYTLISPLKRDLISFVQRLCTTAVLRDTARSSSSSCRSTSLLLTIHLHFLCQAQRILMVY